MATVAKSKRSRKSKGSRRSVGATLPGPPRTPESLSSSSSAANAEERKPDFYASPARTARIEEKHELQNLNHRLEFYILRQREHEAGKQVMARELRDLRKQTQEELDNVRGPLMADIEQLRSERGELAKDVARLKADNSRVTREHTALQDAFEQEQKYREEAQAKSEDLNSQLSEAQAEIRRQTEDANNSKHSLVTEQQTNRRLTSELKKERQARDAAEARVAPAEAHAQARQQDYDRVRAQLDNLRERNQQDVQKLTDQNTSIEQELREEFAKQLNKILAERQEQYEIEKDAMLDELKHVYDEKITAYNERADQMSHDLEVIKAEKTQLEEFRDGHDAEVESLKQKLAQTEELLEMEKAKPHREIQNKIRIIKRLKEAYARKEGEFDSLMDTKIALAMEIRAYRMMLDQEERRLKTTSGWKSPARPRKRRRVEVEEDEQPEGQEGSQSSDSGETIPDTNADDGSIDGDAPMTESPGETASPSQADLVISEMDIEGAYVVLRNSGASDMELTGWKLANSRRTNLFALPAGQKLAPGDALRVLCGVDEAKAKPPSVLVWTQGFDGESGLLLNPDGEVASTVAIQQ